jgi:hypothetical protein
MQQTALLHTIIENSGAVRHKTRLKSLTTAVQSVLNCASVVYRCLNAGGLFGELSSNASSQVSSIVTPDDLLRCIVAAKEGELNSYSETRDWKTIEDESSLPAIKNAYTKVGKNANCEEALDIIPTIPEKTCIII